MNINTRRRERVQNYTKSKQLDATAPSETEVCMVHQFGLKEEFKGEHNSIKICDTFQELL